MEKKIFFQEIYNVVASIPVGKVLTYGQVACLIGKPSCSRRVGQAIHQAPADLGLPCHRVVNSQGRLASCWPEQRDLLKKEGVSFKKNGCVDMVLNRWDFFKESTFL